MTFKQQTRNQQINLRLPKEELNLSVGRRTEIENCFLGQRRKRQQETVVEVNAVQSSILINGNVIALADARLGEAAPTATTTLPELWSLKRNQRIK